VEYWESIIAIIYKFAKMGMFDSVYVKCPKCETENEFQSKSGDCLCSNYTLENCPEDVLFDVNRHSPYRCECGILYEVDIEKRKSIESYNCKKERNHKYLITKTIYEINGLTKPNLSTLVS